MEEMAVVQLFVSTAGVVPRPLWKDMNLLNFNEGISTTCKHSSDQITPKTFVFYLDATALVGQGLLIFEDS